MNHSHTPVLSETFIQRLRRARHVCVLTGAGVSAESGVPTFRSAGGLWSQYDPTELATERAFRKDPDLVWSWYSWRRTLIAGVEPNAGHRALAAFPEVFPRFSLITQNVDNLHRRAGSPDVHELHGNIEHSRCIACGIPYHDAAAPPTETAQRCSCGGWIRPGVVWFGESLPEDELRFAQSAAVDCDVFLSVGTSGLVYPAADLPRLAHRSGAYTVEINPEPTGLAPSLDEQLPFLSGVVLPAILQTMMDIRNEGD
ncbi:MAG: NAD-dependent deacylase [Bacteroidia bacterium]|nr:NAD-dependent deacylase [Bacteroidia bacterium]